jgi:hypothetical protein
VVVVGPAVVAVKVGRAVQEVASTARMGPLVPKDRQVRRAPMEKAEMTVNSKGRFVFAEARAVVAPEHEEF